uniref:Uncharacterized protein n=1 Tax=Mimivirus LCMiAC02 TaxID=2506609 RepID=A0A481Z1D7_9VIRU|nr:MAG: hypothetical protein LCMiAC02_05580 [Mimivirus LCMiAC02]
MDYKYKYHKYKHKYIKLKNSYSKNQFGGNEYRITKNINDGVTDLIKSKNLSFVVANIDLNTDEQNIGKKIKVNSNKKYEYYGIIEKGNQTKYISKFIQSLNNNKNISDDVANLYMEKIINLFLNAMNKDSAWIAIRASLPTDDFKVPRWHQDGYYYKAREFSTKKIKLPKLVFVVKGDTTPFKSVSKKVREDFIELYRKLYKKLDFQNLNKKLYLDIRKQLDNLLKKSPTIQASNLQAGIFLVGLKEFATIHSEPDIKEKRLFLSIVPGSKDEIEELSKKWNKPFSKPIYG